MDNFIKENWFKVGMVISILILAIFIFKSPLEISDADYLKLSIQCREDGEKLLQEDKNTATQYKYKEGIVNCYYMEPNFIFNRELNTCLYSGGYSCELQNKQTEGVFKGLPSTRWNRRIVDVYSNKSFADVYVENSSNVEDWNLKLIENFWEKSKSLGF